jgi:deoxyribodipyrimidine photo-lyase
LGKLPTKYIHEPWKASAGLLEVTGADVYPSPIIDHQAGRARALGALAKFKA